ncbi:hypothetical protein [Yersinia enterocolitica]|nr:hypothetical protein [Yersinia enterocolitica]EKN4829476.1 hypothetical protein [Yersinia enterocolitica]EKN4851464.1 hypothetical protein [Yersinia enterocolitica]ELW8175728.1 hypothetical protein [Yersinia enterocolitica]
MTKKRHPITVGELLDQLKGFDPDAELYFGGLDFYRPKLRSHKKGHKIVQIEFNQTVSLDGNGLVKVENHYPDDEPDVR